jgi:hypothetical protein
VVQHHRPPPMAKFYAGGHYSEYNPATGPLNELALREGFDTGLGDFFDPAVDEHSAFYHAMERDKHAAHLVAGTSFLDLNNVILTTECNNAHESMNEEDIHRLRKLMWDVYIPHIQDRMQTQMSDVADSTRSFQAQMYVVHLSVRVAQALQLVFELNQKKSFSAVVKTAYEVALQDVLYHPSLKGRVKPMQYPQLINYLRRHPAYATAFNTYVGYKLLRQQLVRSGGAGTNRKSNDAERLHDEAANRLWGVLEENRDIFNEFSGAFAALTMEWHKLYYKEVAKTLFQKLASYNQPVSNSGYMDMSAEEYDSARKELATKLADPAGVVGEGGAAAGAAGAAAAVGSAAAVAGEGGGRGGTGGRGGVGTASGIQFTGGDSGRIGYNVAAAAAVPGGGGGRGTIDIVSTIRESRDTVAEGTSKRTSLAVAHTTATLTPTTDTMLAKRQCVGGGGGGGGSNNSSNNSNSNSNNNDVTQGGVGDRGLSTANERVRRAYDAIFH